MIHIVAFLTVFMLGANLSPHSGYLVPEISKATLTLEENQVIGDKKPPTVINIRTYKNPDGSIFRAYAVGGHIFRYDVGVNGAPPFQYRLIDENGDGIFEKKEAMTGEMKIKGQTRDYFIDLGPTPGIEYRYSYEKIGRPGIWDQKKLLEGLPIYIPAWVVLRWDLLK